MVAIDTHLARRLVDGQFPEWRSLPLRPVPKSGHDNRTFRLGDTMSVRLPSAAPYAAHVAIEHEWLPRLAPALPLPVPQPIALGEPQDPYPWPWTVNSWIPAEGTVAAGVRDLDELAADLATFLLALQQIDARGGPAPGAHNFHRGGSLAVYAADTDACLAELAPLLDTAAARRVWQRALDSRSPATPRWLHGDMAADNLLVANGRLCAVIDFGQLAAGDPACDLTVAWTQLDARSRATFKRRLDVDAGTWDRARGWALWKALLRLREAHRGGAEPTGHLRLLNLLIEA